MLLSRRYATWFCLLCLVSSLPFCVRALAGFLPVLVHVPSRVHRLALDAATSYSSRLPLPPPAAVLRSVNLLRSPSAGSAPFITPPLTLLRFLVRFLWLRSTACYLTLAAIACTAALGSPLPYAPLISTGSQVPTFTAFSYTHSPTSLRRPFTHHTRHLSVFFHPLAADRHFAAPAARLRCSYHGSFAAWIGYLRRLLDAPCRHLVLLRAFTPRRMDDVHCARTAIAAFCCRLPLRHNAADITAFSAGTRFYAVTWTCRSVLPPRCCCLPRMTRLPRRAHGTAPPASHCGAAACTCLRRCHSARLFVRRAALCVRRVTTRGFAFTLRWLRWIAVCLRTFSPLVHRAAAVPWFTGFRLLVRAT